MKLCKYRLALCVMLFLSGISYSYPQRVYQKAEQVLIKSEWMTLNFYGSYAAQPEKESIALLILVSRPTSVEFFETLTDHKGVPALYGLIGLHLMDKRGEKFRDKMSKVLQRDRGLKVKTVFGDVVGASLVEDIILMPSESNDRRLLNYGRYASQVFGKTPLKQLNFVIENGLLAENLTNPYFDIMFADSDSLDEPELIKNRAKGERVVKDNLLYQNPTSILEMLGYTSEQELLKGLE